MTTASHDVLIRPMSVRDLDDVERLSAESYHELDLRMHSRALPAPEPRSQSRASAWRARTAHLLSTDPDGCWVAEQDGEIVGFAVAYIRELMWLLASYAVRPSLQGQGVGRALLDVTLDYGRGCLRGLFCASADPAAVRRYRLAGFTMHPHMFLLGSVSRHVLPVVRQVRAGTADDIELMNSVDRRIRGSAHLSDHEILMRAFRLIVTDRPHASGYAYVDDAGAPVLVAATQRRTAAALVWEALSATEPSTPIQIHHITANNQWTLDVGLAARLAVHQDGYLAVRNMQPPAPYLPHGSLL